MNFRILFVIGFFFLFSCQKENDEIIDPESFSQEIKFTVSEILQPGTDVKLIELTDDGYYYCTGKTIFFVNSDRTRKIKSFDSESDVTCLEYNSRENSSLPDNLIHQVVYKNNSIYVVSGNPDKSGTIVSKIIGNKWNALFESGGCSINSMDIDSNGDIYYVSDGREYCGGGLMSDEVVFSFHNQQKIVLREYEESMDIPYLLKVDKRNYVWVARYPLHMGNIISVFDGEKWNKAPEDFPDVTFYCIEVDEKNNIWLGTSDGIYILNQ